MIVLVDGWHGSTLTGHFAKLVGVVSEGIFKGRYKGLLDNGVMDILFHSELFTVDKLRKAEKNVAAVAVPLVTQLLQGYAVIGVECTPKKHKWGFVYYDIKATVASHGGVTEMGVIHLVGVYTADGDFRVVFAANKMTGKEG